MQTTTTTTTSPAPPPLVPSPGVQVLSPSQDDAAHLVTEPLQPAARTDMREWMQWHEQLVAELEAAKAGEGATSLLYGDSILEAFRGSSVGRPMKTRYAGNIAAWAALAPEGTVTLAVAGDRAEHLLWRLRNGEGPKGLSPSRILILIGTNDVAHLSSGLGVR